MLDPTAGIWMTEDPIGFDAGDPNLRRYVGNNATNGTDRSGLQDVRGPWVPKFDESGAFGDQDKQKEYYRCYGIFFDATERCLREISKIRTTADKRHVVRWFATSAGASDFRLGVAAAASSGLVPSIAKHKEDKALADYTDKEVDAMFEVILTRIQKVQKVMQARNILTVSELSAKVQKAQPGLLALTGVALDVTSKMPVRATMEMSAAYFTMSAQDKVRLIGHEVMHVAGIGEGKGSAAEDSGYVPGISKPGWFVYARGRFAYQRPPQLYAPGPGSTDNVFGPVETEKLLCNADTYAFFILLYADDIPRIFKRLPIDK